MSAMVGTLPDAFTNEFLSLTDHLPVSRLEEVYRIIQRTFQKPPKAFRSSDGQCDSLLLTRRRGVRGQVFDRANQGVLEHGTRIYV